MMSAQAVLNFWFTETEPRQWWEKSPEFDALIAKRFGRIHSAAANCECSGWRASAPGCLAEVIVLDQFSRNIFRGRSEAFACDPLALALAQHAVASGFDLELPPQQRAFLYMPFMHSESALIHQEAMALFHQPGLEQALKFELAHKAIIERFGRYPHRNAILNRPSTEEELAFLAKPRSSF